MWALKVFRTCITEMQPDWKVVADGFQRVTFDADTFRHQRPSGRRKVYVAWATRRLYKTGYDNGSPQRGPLLPHQVM